MKAPRRARRSEQAARSVGAVAAVRLIASSEGKVEVWVADRVTGKAVVRELDSPGAGASDAAVAIGSVELLRASLMELHSGSHPTETRPRTTRFTRSRCRRLRRRELPAWDSPWGPGPSLGSAASAPSADADIGLWVRATSRIGACLVGHTSLSPAHVVTASGAVDVRSQVVGAMATFSWVDASSASSRWVPTLSIGVAASRVSATGTAVPPFVSASEATWSAGPLGALGFAWSFAPGLRLRADSLAVLRLAPRAREHPDEGHRLVGRARAHRLVRTRGVVEALNAMDARSRSEEVVLACA